ncbi:hypothetical protein JCM33374_g4301 [Metschnikowia sp. JCM 33374]|nr:hypothetical protein JCM33374_g4301 [Metschnikowia sp. JCM 33374]
MTFAEGKPPTLIRTSRLSSEYIRKNLDTINVPIRLKTDESFGQIKRNWSEEELKNERRLVSLEVNRENFTTFNIKFSTVPPSSVPKDHKGLIISCIRWKEKDMMVVTSVDILLVLESLVGEPFSVEEKSRIRRNLQFLKPNTIARSTSGRLFHSLMSMENPRPRNIEKDVKVFNWNTFFDALNKVLSKYSANPAVFGPQAKAPVQEYYPTSMQPPSSHFVPLTYEVDGPPNPTTHAPTKSKDSMNDTRGLDRDLQSNSSGFPKPTLPYSHPAPWANFPNQQQYFKSDADANSISVSEASGNLTDLSLKSKPQTAATSTVETTTGDSPEGTRANSGTESGRAGDDDSISDHSNSMGTGFTKGLGIESGENDRKDSDASSMSSTSSQSKLLNGAGEKLSWANMKEHDRQWAEISNNGDRMNKLDHAQQKSSSDDKSDSISEYNNRAGSKRRRAKRARKEKEVATEYLFFSRSFIPSTESPSNRTLFPRIRQCGSRHSLDQSAKQFIIVITALAFPFIRLRITQLMFFIRSYEVM